MVTDLKTVSSLKPKPNNESKTQYLNFGEEDQMEIAGYKLNPLKQNLTIIGYFFSFGLLRLVFHWYPHLQLLATHSKCSLRVAEKLLVLDNYKDKYKSYFVKDILTLRIGAFSENSYFNLKESKKFLKFTLCDGTKRETLEARVVNCKKLSYVWDEERNKFLKLSGLDKGSTRNELHGFQGFNKEDQAARRIIYGSNEIIVPVQTIPTLLILEALTPFYIFQLFSLIVWIAEYYYYYTIAIIIMSTYGIATSIIQTRKNQKNLKGTIHSSDKAIVYRGSNLYEEIPASELTPGDLIVIPANGCQMQCDAVLLNGSCIVNESMLTGESVPVTKTALPQNPNPYDVKQDINHTLFCGTKIIQTRNYGGNKVTAVVVRTGFLTAKGELVRSILYPPPADFKFDRDSYKFILILCFIAGLGFVYTVVSKSYRNIAAVDIVIKALDIITIAVPPALPAAMTVGKLYALKRLKQNRIYCINSRVINVSGSIDCVCFDKTGTLTEDELDMWGVIPAHSRDPVKDLGEMEGTGFMEGMVCCHSLGLVGGKVFGDPLDVKMFESTGWILEEGEDCGWLVRSGKEEEEKLEIVHQFHFISALQRMSVIVKKGEVFEAFCKGAPETVMALCNPNSIPEDLVSRLEEYTRQGYRVIGLAKKPLNNLKPDELCNIQREEIEMHLQFLGLIVLENKLKPETTKIIPTLKEAEIKLAMITGDNIQTAVNVAMDCGLIPANFSVIEVKAEKPTKTNFASLDFQLLKAAKIDNAENPQKDFELGITNYHLVLTGSTWSNLTKYFPEQIPSILTKGIVFARMSGIQKQQLIEQLKNLGYYVAMCGDGANDCGALKAAHVGISLSEAESSVASPFTSQEPNISCVPKVLKEGRAALVTSFGVFKLMLCYSLTEFASVIILYGIDTNLTSLQYLFIDIFLILNFASFFGKTKAFDLLAKTPPMTSLLSFIPLSSIVAFMFLTVLYQVFAYYLIQTFSWFQPFIYDQTNTIFYESYENYAIFTTSMFQYITMAVIFSKGKPYRKQIYTNKLFTISLISMTFVCSYITVYPAKWICDVLELKLPPEILPRFAFLLIALLNFFTCFVVEDLFVEQVLRKLSPKLYPSTNKKFLEVLDNLQKDPNWPPIRPVITERIVSNSV